MARADFAFSHRFRVRWSEVDPQAVVFNARYLDYADIAITEYYRAVGFRELHPDAPLEFHVKRATVTWAKPIEADEMIDALVRRKLEAQKRVIEGSDEWDVLYRKYHEDEVSKHRKVMP